MPARRLQGRRSASSSSLHARMCYPVHCWPRRGTGWAMARQVRWPEGGAFGWLLSVLRPSARALQAHAAHYCASHLVVLQAGTSSRWMVPTWPAWSAACWERGGWTRCLWASATPTSCSGGQEAHPSSCATMLACHRCTSSMGRARAPTSATLLTLPVAGPAGAWRATPQGARRPSGCRPRSSSVSAAPWLSIPSVHSACGGRQCKNPDTLKYGVLSRGPLYAAPSFTTQIHICTEERRPCAAPTTPPQA